MDPQLVGYPQLAVCDYRGVGMRRYYSNMRSSSREEVVEVLDALSADMKRAVDLTFDVLTTPERLALLEHCEEIRRMLSAVEHPLINQLAEQADPTELGGKLGPALAALDSDDVNPAH
jgi:hypothetical protein